MFVFFFTWGLFFSGHCFVCRSSCYVSLMWGNFLTSGFLCVLNEKWTAGSPLRLFLCLDVLNVEQKCDLFDILLLLRRVAKYFIYLLFGILIYPSRSYKKVYLIMHTQRYGLSSSNFLDEFFKMYENHSYAVRALWAVITGEISKWCNFWAEHWQKQT